MKDTLIDDISLLDNYYFETHRIIKPLSPRQRQTIIDIEKMSGVIQVSKKFEQNILTIKGEILATGDDQLTERIENLSGFLYSDYDRQIKFSNQIDRYWLGQYLDNPDIVNKYNDTNVDLIFTCNDPFAYAITPDSDDQNITVKDDTYIIANSGHYYSYPVITITFNQVQTHIYMQNNNIVGNRFDIAKAFGIGDELELDSKNETIKLNGTSNPIGLGDGGQGKAEFIILAKDNNELAVGSDDESLDISINLNWRKVYFY